MAVGADQLALRDLVEDRLAPKAAKGHHADLAALRRTRQMIPVHRCMVEDPAAVRARSVALEPSIPLEEFAPMLFAHATPLDACALPVRRVVLLST